MNKAMFNDIVGDYCRLTYVKGWTWEGSCVRITLSNDCSMTVSPSFIFKETIHLLELEAVDAEESAIFRGWYDDAAYEESYKHVEAIRETIRRYKAAWYKKEV